MKRIVLLTVVLALAVILCISCKKADEKRQGLKRLEDMQSSAREDLPSASDYAGQSGSRVNQKIKEKEENEKKNNDDNKDGKDKPSETSSPNDKDPDGAIGTINDRLTQTEHERELSKSDKKKTYQLALSYIKKKVDKSFDGKNLKVADDNSGEYEKYPLYGKGCIIIYEAEVNGKTVFVAIGRTSKDADWKILNKK